MNVNGTNPNNYSKDIFNPSYNAVQINLQKPTLNTTSIIYDYPYTQEQGYYPPITSPTSFGQNINITRTPSGIEDFNNYIETDSSGQEIASVKYAKEGNTVFQQIKTKSPDGTVLEKTTKNTFDSKAIHIDIKDKDGNILFAKEKSYKKFDADKAQTVSNGDVYNITGLSSNIITVEHNGEITKIDLNKMLNPKVKLLKERVSPDKFPIRNKKITDTEKEKLFNRIKSLGGDDLIRLSKSVEHLQLLDENSIESFFTENGKTLLLSPKDWENSHMVTEHELGHAINHSGKKSLISNDEQYKSIRDYEKANFKHNINDLTRGDKLFASKFLNGNPDFEWEDSKGAAEALEANLCDETFAECYNNLNSMDIIHYDDEVLPMRTLSLFKYLPRTLIEANRLSNI